MKDTGVGPQKNIAAGIVYTRTAIFVWSVFIWTHGEPSHRCGTQARAVPGVGESPPVIRPRRASSEEAGLVDGLLVFLAEGGVLNGIEVVGDGQLELLGAVVEPALLD